MLRNNDTKGSFEYKGSQRLPYEPPATIHCKGSFEWETIAKYLIALVILLVLIVLVGMFKDKLLNAFESMKAVFGNG